MAIKSRAKYTSKGERDSVAKKNLTNISEIDIAINKQSAFLKGKRCYVTIDNPNPNDTRARKIRVLASSHLGDYRKYN